MSGEQQVPAAEPIEPDEKMHIDPYERNWMFVAVGTLVVFFIALTIAGFALGIQVPTNEARVDPNTLHLEAPWNEPGLREVVPGEEYDLYMVARRFSFNPRDVTVPAGAKVNFYVTSGDVQHGFLMENTNINMMVLPGQVSKLTATFDEAGTYNYICHEFCGAGHAIMWGTLTVEGGG